MLVAATMPLLVALVIAIAVTIFAPALAVESSTPLPTAIIVVGALFSVVLSATAWALSARRTAFERGEREGRQSQRQVHRQFLARLDHELKNPIMAIQAAVASSEVTGDATQLRGIQSQAARLTRLVGDLRRLADLEQEPLELEQVDLEEVTRDAVDAVRDELAAIPAAGARHFSLEFPRVPSPLAPIRGDRDLLFLAVYNLISNAAKYSADGADIVVRATEESGSAVLEVADTGTGIPPEDLPFVWEELARGGNARGTAGSGLGLALVRAVVVRHGGHTSIRSVPGDGTSVRIALSHAAGVRPTPPGS